MNLLYLYMKILLLKINNNIDYNHFINIYFFNENEIFIINKIKNCNNKKIKIISILLQKYIIKKNLNVNLNNIYIKKNKFGKPYVNNFEYNISHDKDLIGIIYNKDNKVGLDIMSLDRKIDITIFKSIFTNKEYNKIKEKKDFLTYWCLKESYLKAIGLGLNIDLSRLEFLIQYNNIKLYIDNILQNNCYFEYFIYENKYIICICIINK